MGVPNVRDKWRPMPNFLYFLLFLTASKNPGQVTKMLALVSMPFSCAWKIAVLVALQRPKSSALMIMYLVLFVFLTEVIFLEDYGNMQLSLPYLFLNQLLA